MGSIRTLWKVRQPGEGHHPHAFAKLVARRRGCRIFHNFGASLPDFLDESNSARRVVTRYYELNAQGCPIRTIYDRLSEEDCKQA